MPALTACGSRESAYDEFRIAHAKNTGAVYVALLVDSEAPVGDVEETWSHLATQDGWEIPAGAENDQVLLMTTCMESWLVADHGALKRHFGPNIKLSRLPSGQGLEAVPTKQVLRSLRGATRNCSAPYAKGPRSFDILGKLAPEVISSRLPSFRRAVRILGVKLA